MMTTSKTAFCGPILRATALPRTIGFAALLLACGCGDNDDGGDNGSGSGIGIGGGGNPPVSFIDGFCSELSDCEGRNEAACVQLMQENQEGYADDGCRSEFDAFFSCFHSNGQCRHSRGYSYEIDDNDCQKEGTRFSECVYGNEASCDDYVEHVNDLACVPDGEFTLDCSGFAEIFCDLSVYFECLERRSACVGGGLDLAESDIDYCASLIDCD